MIDLDDSARHTPLHLRFWLPFARCIAQTLLFVLGPLRVRGKYRIPKDGGLLILANHVSDIDPIVVHCACPRPIHFMAKHELFEMRVLGRWIRGFGAFPVNRGAPDRAALKLAARLLNQGEVVGLFPEGQLSEDGKLQEVKGGVALIIRQAAGVPVICCGLRGTDRIIPYQKVVPRPAFHSVNVVWGEPRTFQKNDPTEDILGWITSEFRNLTDES